MELNQSGKQETFEDFQKNLTKVDCQQKCPIFIQLEIFVSWNNVKNEYHGDSNVLHFQFFQPNLTHK
jgi:hypothetical protein